MSSSTEDGGSSQVESDAEALPRVHPRGEPMPTLHGFACDFSRGRCGHEQLFHPHYTRTNLRKGDKILRCFPHCCPDHVSRSFCGASLHLDVSWENAAPRPASAPDVSVFARFRVKDTRGLVAGDHVTLHEINQSLQSESNPHGEWIPAVTVSSVSDGDQPRQWVFEINHEARWYYHWESGVAKRHRLKHHVLDVYVLSPSFSETSAAAASAGDHQPLQVVASTHSPPFRLISFRRATPKAVQALSVPRVPLDDRSGGTRKPAPRVPVKKSPSPPSGGRPVSPRRGYPGGMPSHYDARPQPPLRGPGGLYQDRDRFTPPLGSSSRSNGDGPSFADLTAFIDRREQSFRPGAPSAGPPPLRTPMPLLTSPRPLSSASPVQARTAQRVLRLLRCLDRVRAADSLQHMDTFQRVYADAIARAAGVRGAPPSWSPVEVVGQLLVDIGAIPSNRMSTPSSMPSELAAILCELLLWLSFDVDLHRAVHSTITQEATAVFSQPRLQVTYLAFVEWLERHVDALLQNRGWRLEDVVSEVSALDMRTGARHTRESGGDPYDALAVGMRFFVAQSSEQFVKQTKGRTTARRPLKPAVRVPRSVRSARARSSWSTNGTWKCGILEGGLQARSLAPSGDSHNVSLQSLFAVLRELGTISIRVDGDHQATTLDVSSLLNVGGHEAGSRLVLDGSSQWFRSFPSGVSTSALSIGALQWGDHSGEVSESREELQVNLYAWKQRESPVDDLSSIGLCFQLQLWTPSADVLVVRVAVTRALLDRPAAYHQGLPSVEAVAAQLPFWSLQKKLRLVRAWEPSLSAELRYARVAA